jgi:hypothetical protein
MATKTKQTVAERLEEINDLVSELEVKIHDLRFDLQDEDNFEWRGEGSGWHYQADDFIRDLLGHAEFVKMVAYELRTTETE